eukprot:3033836-Rhodomonas_salina.1
MLCDLVTKVSCRDEGLVLIASSRSQREDLQDLFGRESPGIALDLSINGFALNSGGCARLSQCRSLFPRNRSWCVGRGSFGEVLLDASLDTVLGSFGSAPSSAFDRHN